VKSGRVAGQPPDSKSLHAHHGSGETWKQRPMVRPPILTCPHLRIHPHVCVHRPWSFRPFNSTCLRMEQPSRAWRCAWGSEVTGHDSAGVVTVAVWTRRRSMAPPGTAELLAGWTPSLKQRVQQNARVRGSALNCSGPLSPHIGCEGSSRSSVTAVVTAAGTLHRQAAAVHQLAMQQACSHWARTQGVHCPPLSNRRP
jgi:hypothetical protein